MGGPSDGPPGSSGYQATLGHTVTVDESKGVVLSASSYPGGGGPDIICKKKIFWVKKRPP